MHILTIVLRFLHVFGGAFWFGASVILGFYISPTVAATGEVGQKFMGSLVLNSHPYRHRCRRRYDDLGGIGVVLDRLRRRLFSVGKIGPRYCFWNWWLFWFDRFYLWNDDREESQDTCRDWLANTRQTHT